jgi:hypothetical protein
MKKFRNFFNEGKGINYIFKSEKEVEDVLMELSYENGLGKDDYENNSSRNEYAIYSNTINGQKAIEKVAKGLKISFKKD